MALTMASSSLTLPAFETLAELLEELLTKQFFKHLQRLP